MEHIEFVGDENFSKKNNQRNKIPTKGIEGWLYKKIPGSPIVKKIILILIILILFAISVSFFVLAKTDFKTEETINFQERVKSTQLK